MQLTDYASYFNIPPFLFLRKCAAIRKELRLMGYPNAQVQLRNIPVGSEHYYACFSECCYATGYQIQRDEKGEVIEVIPFSKLKFEEEEIDDDDVESEDAVEEDGSDVDLLDISVYSLPDPRNIEIYVYDDERINFIPSTDYTLKKAQAAQALDEIENESGQIFVTSTKISSWLARHHDFYWSLEMDYNVLAFRAFQTLYSQFQYLADTFQHMEKAQQAVDEYKPFDEDWLYNYDRLFFCSLMGWEFGYEVFHEDPFILKQEFSKLHLVGEEFRGLYEFPKLFDLEDERERRS